MVGTEVKSLSQPAPEAPDPFEQGVETTSAYPAIYIDPKEFQTSPEDILKLQEGTATPEEEARIRESLAQDAETLRDQLNSQIPALADEASIETLVPIVERSKVEGPFVFNTEHEGQGYCLVNKPDDWIDEKHEIASGLSGRTPEELGTIPGTDELWNRAIGVHEGAHCAADHLQPITVDDISNPPIILNRERIADNAAKDDLIRNGHDDVAEALHDYRALRAGDDPEHATSPLIDPGDTQATTGAHIEAATGLQGYMVDSVSNALGISLEDAQKMQQEDPQKFIDTLLENAENGMYDNRPALKEYIVDYAEAYNRQILDEPAGHPQAPGLPDFQLPPLEMIEGGSPSIVPGEVRDSMQIGGVSASQFFASHAHPAAAQERLDMQNQPAVQMGTAAPQQPRLNTPGL